MPARSWRRIKERYGLIGSKCENCGTHYFPVKHICKKCRRRGKVVRYKFSGLGSVYSFSLVASPPEGFKNEAPYIIALIELEEGVRLTSQVVDWQGKAEVKIGDKVEVVFRKIQQDGDEGIIQYGFKFKPVPV